MEQREKFLLKKQFEIGSQGYTLVDTIIFVYAIKKSGLDLNDVLIDRKELGVQDQLHGLKDCAMDNLDLIKEKISSTFADLVKDCIVSFNPNVITGSGMIHCLDIVSKMTEEEIVEFLVHDLSELNSKYDFNTPSTLIELMYKLLNKNEDQSWYDLGCGMGDTLVNIALKKPYDTYAGDDIKVLDDIITKIRLYFVGVRNFNIHETNVLSNSFKEIADVGMATIPFNVKEYSTVDKYNLSNKYIKPIKSNQTFDWLFVDRLLQKIKDRAIVIMPEGRLMNDIDIEQRKSLIDSNLIEGIIKLPLNIFSYTGISTSLIVFNKNKKTNKVKILDASNMCDKGRRVSNLKYDDIFNAYNSSKVLQISNDNIANNDYLLNVNKYLSVNDIVLLNEEVLSNVVKEVFRGVQIPASTIDEYSKVSSNEDVYNLVSLGDMQQGTFDIKRLHKIKNDGKFDRYLINNGDLLISCKSSKIKTAIVDIKAEEKVVATGSLLVIRCDTEKINPIYLKTFLDSTNGLKLLESIQTGTTIISINAKALLNMKISCLDMNKQKEIAEKYLLKLDQLKVLKLKLNRLERDINNFYDESIGG